MLSVKVKALEAIKIGQFFGEDLVFTKDVLNDWYEKLKVCAADLKHYLGVSIGVQSTPIVTAQRLLGLLGYRLKALDRIRINGVLDRQARIDAADRSA